MSPNPLDDDATLKRLLALIVTIWVMLLTTGIVAYHMYCSLKNITYAPPESITWAFSFTVFSGLFMLGAATSAIGRALLSKKPTGEE